MQTKTLFVALTLGASCFAAPLAIPPQDGVVARNPACADKRGYGLMVVCESAAEKREPEAEVPEEARSLDERTGYGILSSDKDEARSLDKRTGYGILSSDKDEARSLEKKTGYGILSSDKDEARSLDKKTGYGIVSNDNKDEARSLDKRTGYGILSSGNDDA